MIKEGTKAPDFSLDSDSGQKLSLRDFSGRTLILYFYPKDDTPGCTREAQAFTAARWAIDKAGGAVVGVSKDSVATHCKFRDKYGLSIPLISDPDLKLHKAYGAWGEKNMYGKKVQGTIRSTFLVKDGRVARVFPKVNVDGHADEILAALGKLGGGHSILPPPDAPPKAKKAAAKKPAAKKPAAKKPAAKKPAAKKPAAKKKAAPPKKKAVAVRAKKPAKAKKKSASAAKKK